MKYQILDDTLVDDLRWSLEPDEKIIWEGEPNITSLFSNPFKNSKTRVEHIIILIKIVTLGMISLFFILLMILFLVFTYSILRYIIIFLILIYLGIKSYRHVKRKRTKYTITNKRIIFQLWEIKNLIVHHDLPFTEIKNIAITEEYKNTGVIYLGLKNPSLVPFETKNLMNGDQRHQPTLEFIDNVQEVGNYIQQGIQGEL